MNMLQHLPPPLLSLFCKPSPGSLCCNTSRAPQASPFCKPSPAASLCCFASCPQAHCVAKPSPFCMSTCCNTSRAPSPFCKLSPGLLSTCCNASCLLPYCNAGAGNVFCITASHPTYCKKLNCVADLDQKKHKDIDYYNEPHHCSDPSRRATLLSLVSCQDDHCPTNQRKRLF